jgi:hypothetical protein
MNNQELIIKLRQFVTELEPVIANWDLFKPSYQYDCYTKYYDKLFDRKCTIDDLYSKSRCSELILLKHSIIYILYSNFSGCIATKDLADAFKLKDHTTILHAIKKIENFIDIKDKECRKCLDLLYECIEHKQLLNSETILYKDIIAACLSKKKKKNKKTI